jgi:Ni,Fe-hydrogenase I large subunit
MIVRELIEKIEGEAELDFTFNDGKIEDVRISFGFYRGMEEILEGKDARDALVITPRVCGICNHAHLIAAVEAIENGYENAGLKVELSSKAKAIREFTLSCELMQNHMTWFYMTIFPKLEKLLGEASGENHALKGSYFSSTVTKAMSIFSGQWPHSSYAVPGGVTCDPTYVDVMQVENLLDELIRFYEEMVIGMPMETYLQMNASSFIYDIHGDLGRVLQLFGMNEMAEMGQSHDRFISFGDSILFKAGKSMKTRVYGVDVNYVEESTQKKTLAKAVNYKQKLYEVGPLARAMVSKEPMVKKLHKRYKDSILTRVFARVHEVSRLLLHSKALLQDLRMDEPSCTLGNELMVDDFEGIGVVEAARGSLIHKTTVKEGLIENYEIIVPTQWNLSHGNDTEHGIAIEAMVGASSTEEATFIFRTFDVCSVCTTQ